MERMEHVHGKLLEGEVIVVDDVDCHLGCHANPKNGLKSYYGYMEFGDEHLARLDPNVRYRLQLDDGRSGEMFALFHPTNLAGRASAEFHLASGLMGRKTRSY